MSSKIGKGAQRQLSPQLKAITLRITDSCELTYGTGILRRVALPAENDSAAALTPTLCLITSSELIPSGEDALDARVELAAPGATDFACHELVHLLSCDLVRLFLTHSLIMMNIIFYYYCYYFYYCYYNYH